MKTDPVRAAGVSVAASSFSSMPIIAWSSVGVGAAGVAVAPRPRWIVLPTLSRRQALGLPVHQTGFQRQKWRSTTKRLTRTKSKWYRYCWSTKRWGSALGMAALSEALNPLHPLRPSSVHTVFEFGNLKCMYACTYF